MELVWENRASFGHLALGRHHPITFANDTHGFLLTGTTRSSLYTNDFLIYDESTDTWSNLTNTPSAFPGMPRTLGYGVVFDDATDTKAYLGFGLSPTGFLSDWWEFDMSSHVWKQLVDLPLPGRGHPAVIPVRTAGGATEIHVGLGTGSTGNLNDWWSYDVALDAWTELLEFPAAARHHPFYFGIEGTAYVGLGHGSNFIGRDFYAYNVDSVGIGSNWSREPDFISYKASDGVSVTSEGRVAGTQFSIKYPTHGVHDIDSVLTSRSLGFILSGDGDDHSTMAEGEFHVFYPARGNGEISQWRCLPPHPGKSRWAPGSFVMRGSARAYFMAGLERVNKTFHADLWRIDLSELFQSIDISNVPTLPAMKTGSPTVTDPIKMLATSDPTPGPILKIPATVADPTIIQAASEPTPEPIWKIPPSSLPTIFATSVPGTTADDLEKILDVSQSNASSTNNQLLGTGYVTFILGIAILNHFVLN
mmetsp:Transcript_10251/g.22756  ORF Transcript_10251/g.22756 Transcript_10251/m.22756 type:complete len:477 (-) Transcript_10251:80-1510(-)